MVSLPVAVAWKGAASCFKRQFGRVICFDFLAFFVSSAVMHSLCAILGS